MAKTSKIHRRINNMLTVIAVLLALYILLFPFLPQISWKISHPSGTVAANPSTTPASETKTDVPAESLLLIPRIGMRETIHSGSSISELNNGAWLLPNTSQPNLDSNTVIVGHRFTYSGPGVFYHLDKVESNDTITIYWSGKEYRYRVVNQKVVPATEVSVQQPADSPQLTLYTCTPLWTAKDRLVITAMLVGVYP